MQCRLSYESSPQACETFSTIPDDMIACAVHLGVELSHRFMVDVTLVRAHGALPGCNRSIAACQPPDKEDLARLIAGKLYLDLQLWYALPRAHLFGCPLPK
jgi:hypothetical protein